MFAFFMFIVLYLKNRTVFKTLHHCLFAINNIKTDTENQVTDTFTILTDHFFFITTKSKRRV